MQNTSLWRALGRNTIVSLILFGALLGLLWTIEFFFPSLHLLKWENTAWLVGIPASIIGVAYILTVRDPKNYTGFFAGIVMSFLLGIQFLLQEQYDSTFLYFFVFIPFQMMSIYKWSRSKDDGGASFEPKFLDTPRLILSVAMLIFITAGDLIIMNYVNHGSPQRTSHLVLFPGELLAYLSQDRLVDLLADLQSRRHRAIHPAGKYLLYRAVHLLPGHQRHGRYRMDQSHQTREHGMAQTICGTLNVKMRK